VAARSNKKWLCQLKLLVDEVSDPVSRKPFHQPDIAAKAAKPIVYGQEHGEPRWKTSLFRRREVSILFWRSFLSGALKKQYPFSETKVCHCLTSILNIAFQPRGQLWIVFRTVNDSKNEWGQEWLAIGQPFRRCASAHPASTTIHKTVSVKIQLASYRVQPKPRRNWNRRSRRSTWSDLPQSQWWNSRFNSLAKSYRRYRK